MSERFQILMVGVGGQGVITASHVLGEAAHDAGLEVVVGQLHGMSQRGGSVECSVLVGPGDSSFVIGAPDLVIAFEPLEALRTLPRLGASTHVVVNSGRILPPPVLSDAAKYPPMEEIIARLGDVTSRLSIVDAPALVAQVGVPRTLNLVMLGALAGLALLPFDGARIWDAARHRLRERFLEENLQAFELGRQSVSQGRRKHA